MLADLENELIAMIQASPLGPKLREVDSLPELDGENLIKRFSTVSPAAYVAPANFSIERSGLALPRYGISLVAKNSRGQKEALQGDGISIGLYQMVDAVLGMLNNGSTASSAWIAVSLDFVHEELLFRNGLYVAVVKVEGSQVQLPDPIDETTLADFLTFHADYDITPFQTPTVQAEWSQQNYVDGQPDAQDDVTL